MASRAGNHTELLTLPRGGQGAGRRAPNGGIPAPVVGETVSLMRWCPVCGDEMTPEFGSPCEDPIAWACRACGFLQLETGVAAGDAPGGAPARREPERRREERAAKAFAAELLMPTVEVRAEFGRSQPRLRQAMGQREREDLLQQGISDLAHTFQVSRA